MKQSTWSGRALRRSFVSLLFATPLLGAEEPRQAAAPLELTTLAAGSERAPAWSREWQVLRLTIPSTGRIDHAFVDLRAPSRDLTLPPGLVSREGVMVARVEWSSAPTRAKITLRRGVEQVDYWIGTDLVAYQDALAHVENEVTVETRFFETMEDGAETARIMQAIGPPATEIVDAKRLAHVSKILAEANGVHLLMAPRVTTRSGQTARIEATRPFSYPTQWNPPEGESKEWVGTVMAKRELGVSLEITPACAEDGTLQVILTARTVDLLGFFDAGLHQHLETAQAATTPVAGAREPVFSVRKSERTLNLQAGQSVILRLAEDAAASGKWPQVNQKRKFCVVSAQWLHAKNPPPEEEAPPQADPEVPMGVAVPGKPGFVKSPFAPDKGYIDVRGFEAGTEVKDPYTGRRFFVP